MKLNLGCGPFPLEGWENVDRNPGPGIVVADVEDGLPFPDSTFDHILASHVLEHVIRFDRAWNELTRVLKVGGTIEVRVPYKRNYDPYHIRQWSRESVRRLTGTARGCLDDAVARYEEVWTRVTKRAGFPFWHAEHHLGVLLPPFPFLGPRHAELRFVLRLANKGKIIAGNRRNRFALSGAPP